MWSVLFFWVKIEWKMEWGRGMESKTDLENEICHIVLFSNECIVHRTQTEFSLLGMLVPAICWLISWGGMCALCTHCVF